MKIVTGSILLAAALAVRAQDNFADTVVSYVAGSTYDSSYQNPDVALGAPTTSATINAPAYATSQICVINPGGELTLGFDAPIVNDPADHADGMDFTIFGNDFFTGSKITSTYDHPGLTVWVSQNDVNFYELDVPNGYGADDSFPTEGSGNPLLPVNPSLTLSSFVGLTDAQALSLYGGSAGGASFSISWAVDANGDPIDLSSINEIEIIPTTGYGLVDAVARVESVPEPATMELFCAGVLLFSFGRWWEEHRGSVHRFGLFKSKIKPLNIMRIFLMLMLGLLAVSSAGAFTIKENFTNNPAQDGWQVFGDTNLFQWDSTNNVLDVTWDSSQENSYFYHPLGTTLTSTDNFCLSFDLNLSQAEASGFSFQVAVGLLNFSEATNADFLRGTGYSSPDLVEFNYFPEVPGISATIWPALVDSNSTVNYNDNTNNDYAVYTPNLCDWYHIVMTYTASNLTLVTTMTNFEQTSGVTVVQPINTTDNYIPFADFQVDTLSISSYSGEDSGSSVYAQGAVSNIVLHAPSCLNAVVGPNNPIIFTENFTNDPAQKGWQVFGDTNLFQWDSTNDVIDVTWDSSQVNSYFYHPLGTTLIQADSFSLSFDIQLNSIEYSDFPVLAVGLFNYCDATNSNFSRPGATTPNLFEFDYYPDDGLTPPEPNVAATLTDDTGGLTNDADFDFIWDYLPMNFGTTYHVTLTHAAGQSSLTATMCAGGQVYTTMPYVYDAEAMSDFRLDTLSISSYQDEYDPLFAQGTVGNFVVTLPPPGRNFEFALHNGVPQVRFGTYTNWNYMLERSTNLFTWCPITPCVCGNGRVLTFCDTNAPATCAFYRIRADQP